MGEVFNGGSFISCIHTQTSYRGPQYPTAFPHLLPASNSSCGPSMCPARAAHHGRGIVPGTPSCSVLSLAEHCSGMFCKQEQGTTAPPGSPSAPAPSHPPVCSLPEPASSFATGKKVKYLFSVKTTHRYKSETGSTVLGKNSSDTIYLSLLFVRFGAGE